MDNGGCANGDFAPVHLNTASREALLSIGWISVHDADEILQCRGPQGQLYQSQMARLTSLDEEQLGGLVRRGIVTVQFVEDANDMGDTHSVTSVTSSMLEELEAVREENHLLREAMENQSRDQQEILTRFVDEMATHDRTRVAPTGDQFVDWARQRMAADDRSGRQPSLGVSDLEGARESLAWDSLGQPTLTGYTARSTNPFVAPGDSHDRASQPAVEKPGRAEVRYVTTREVDLRDQEGRPRYAGCGIDQGPLREQCDDNSVWAELHRLRLQMDLLIQDARKPQDGLPGMVSAPDSVQFGNGRTVRKSAAVTGYEATGIPGKNSQGQSQLSQMYGGVTQGDDQYFSGGVLENDSGHGAWDSWTRGISPHILPEQPQPLVPDLVSTVGHCDVRDTTGYGRWGHMDEQSAVIEDQRGRQTHGEAISSDEIGSDSRLSRRSSQTSASFRVAQRLKRGSSWWRLRSHSSSASRSPSPRPSSRRRHKSPPFPKLQVFSGERSEWNAFIFQFMKAAQFHGWREQEKCDRLLASLRGKAVDFIMTKPRTLQKHFHELRDALEQRFNRREHPIIARRQLSFLRQAEGESLEDYADRVLAKVSEAYPGVDEEIEQDLAKEAFLKGCQNHSAAYATAEKDPSTLQDTLEEVHSSAVNLKAFGRGSVLTRRVSFVGEEDDGEMENTQANEEFRKKQYEQHRSARGKSVSANSVRCYKCGGYGHMARKCRKELRCFSCGKTGHMRSECLMQEEQIGSQGRETESAPSVRTVYVDQPRDSAATAVGKSKVQQFNWSSNPGLSMEVPVWFGRRKVMAVVDTAAQVTIINRSLSVELGCEAPVERVQLRNAKTDTWMDGGIVEGFGFWLGSRKYSWNVIEADIEDAFILGMDFLKSTRCKIDLGNDILELGSGDQVPATVRRHTSNEAVKVSQVVSSSECTEKLVSNNLDRGMCEGFRTVVSIEATTLPGVSLQDIAQLDSVQPASLGDAHFQGIVQSGASAQDCTRTGSEASTVTLGQVGQKEAGMRSASKPGVTQISAGSKQWRPQQKDSRSQSPDVQTTPLSVQDEPELRGQRSAVHDFWRPRSLLHLRSVRKRRNRSGFWSPRPQLEEWESWRHRARGPAHAKD